MSEEKQPEKRPMTKEYIDQQVEATAQEVNAIKDRLEQTIGVLNYLRFLQREFDLPSAPQKAPDQA